jgi:broad specificity phosphatase PhoE
MKIYLIRHGETTGDVEDRYGGDYDDHLTSKGKDQAKKLAEKIKDFGIERIFTSPRIRAKETSEILKDKLGVEVQLLEDIRERNHYGVLTGMVKSEAKRKYPKLAKMVDDYRNTVEGGEDYESFQKRVKKTLEQVYKSELNTVAIVTHGGPVRMIFREILGYEKIWVDDCAYAVLEYKGGKLDLKDVDGIEVKKE